MSYPLMQEWMLLLKLWPFKNEKYPTIYNFVIDPQGKVLIHPDETLPDTLNQQIFSHLPTKMNTSGSLSYRDGEHQKLAHFKSN